jgi:hypothetical protein
LAHEASREYLSVPSDETPFPPPELLDTTFSLDGGLTGGISLSPSQNILVSSETTLKNLINFPHIHEND